MLREPWDTKRITSKMRHTNEIYEIGTLAKYKQLHCQYFSQALRIKKWFYSLFNNLIILCKLVRIFVKIAL